MNILIIEDEKLAYEKLLKYLSLIFVADFDHHHLRSVKEGIDLLSSPLSFDLIISDIKIIGGSSFDIFSKVNVNTPIIFCTAYDNYLLQAFQTNGIAYILKPYTKEDLGETVKKFQNLFQEKPLAKSMFQEFQELLQKRDTSYKKRFAIKKSTGTKLLEVKDVCYVEAFGNLSRLKDQKNEMHTLSSPIGSLQKELDPAQFFRINRSYIVNKSFIESIQTYGKNKLVLKIKGLDKTVMTSTTTTKDFRVWIEY